jgi:putative membrane protein
MKSIGFLWFALVAMSAVGCSNDRGSASAQTKASERATPATSVPADMASRDARDFVHHIAIVNATEIELGKLATDRGSANAVKNYGQMMVRDHGTSGEKVKALASEFKIDAPDRLDDKHADQRNSLARRSGADFDREYATAMVEGHKDLLDQLEPRIDKQSLEQWKAATNGKAASASRTIALPPDKSDNPTTMRVNQLAADLYPTVRAHWDAAKALEKSLEKR